ncbi:MAG: cysteine synthase A [Acholeplasmatales bacterium]|nr:cysteine synthase A [Acholeplasmatales bacterium]
MRIFENIESLIGNTPLVELNNYKINNNISANIIGKLEYLNPAGSVKDRVALEMIKDAEEKKLLVEGSVIIEPTSGNTGIGLAAIASIRGYKTILVMPDSMSKERIVLLKAYGAEVVLTPAKEGMKGAIKKARELALNTPHSFIPGQFTNLANPKAHYRTTAPEIWNDTSGAVDIFVCGIGTGGTISGVGKYLKEKNPDIKIIAVEPKDSPLLTKGTTGSHKLQGLGAGFIPITLDIDIFDEVIDVSTEEAFKACKDVASSDGIVLGISSGAAIHAAKIVGKRLENRGKNIVVLLPDGGSKYLLSPLYNE